MQNDRIFVSQCQTFFSQSEEPRVFTQCREKAACRTFQLNSQHIDGSGPLQRFFQ